MTPPPALHTDPLSVPDNPREISDDAWIQLAIDFAAMHRYIRVQYALCKVPHADPAPPIPAPEASPTGAAR